MPAGLDAGRMTMSRFWQKLRGVVMSFSVKSLVPYLMLALANTSAGAPCSIWATSVSVPWKLKTNLTSLYCGFFFLNTGTMAGNALFSDAAANTLSFGDRSCPPRR